jgi:hypothetical protein
MKKVICFSMLIILFLVSCTAKVEQIPTNAPVLSGTPTEAPKTTPTEIDYSVHPLVLKNESELIDSRINSLVSGVIRNPAIE